MRLLKKEDRHQLYLSLNIEMETLLKINVALFIFSLCFILICKINMADVELVAI